MPLPDRVPWEDLLAWAQSDLRRQLRQRLTPGQGVSASSVIGSVFRRAAQRPDELPRGDRDARNWLFRVACNVLREKSRNARTWRRRPRDGQVVNLGELGELLARGGNGENDGGGAGDAFLREILAALPEEQRALVHALYFEGRTLREFAAQRGMSEREASRLHRRTLERLRSLLPAD